MRRLFRADQALAQQSHDLAIGATALALVFVHHHFFKRIAQNLGDLADVLVAPVARPADHHRASARRHGLHRLHQRGHGVRVVAVVGNDGGALVVENIEAALRIVVFAGKTGQARTQGVPVQTQGPHSCDAGHDVFYLKANRATQRDRNVAQVQVMFFRALGRHHLALVHIHHRMALRAVCGHHRVELVQCKKGDRAFGFGSHSGYHRIGGIEHRCALGCYVLHNHAFEHRQFIDGGDVVQAQMVAAAHIGHHGHIAFVKGQALAQDTAARRLQHCRIHIRMVQDVFRALGAAAVAGINAMAVHIDAIGIGHADAPTLLGQQVRNQAHGRGFAIGAGNGNDGDAAILPVFEQAGHDGFAHGAAFAKRGAEVHAQARRGIDFHHATALFFNRPQDAVAHQVYAANMQAHHVRRCHRPCGYIGMHVIGHIGGRSAGGQISVVTQIYALAFVRNRVCLKTLAAQATAGNIVKADFGERGGMSIAPARIGIDHVHQLRHGMHAVAHHFGRIAPRSGHQFVAHHQQAKIVARHIAFHQHGVAKFDGYRIGGAQLGFVQDVDGHALTLVAVQGLNHHRQPDVLRRCPGVIRIAHRAAARHGHACCV